MPSTSQSTRDRVATASARPSLPLRTKVATAAGALASWVSKKTGRGSGAMIGGRVTLAIDPDALARLAVGRTVVLVTGTNGKTTTTLLTAAALRGLGTVATNSTGANMPDGLVAALTAQPEAPVAVLEIDEGYFPQVARTLKPDAVVLLNLSRDQLDRVGEVRKLERNIREAVNALPETFVVHNCDEVIVTSAAADAARPVPVAAGVLWRDDGVSCPRCGSRIELVDDTWRCSTGDLERPKPEWALEGTDAITPQGDRLPIELKLPGRVNYANTVTAVATAHALGVPIEDGLAGARSVTEVAGRYRTVEHDGRRIRLLLAKNPAGWAEMLAMLASSDEAVMLSVNGREADGKDLSWLWDVPFEQLQGRRVAVTGERRADLAVRLAYADVEHVVAETPDRALAQLPEGPAQVVANYTAFRDLLRDMPDA